MKPTREQVLKQFFYDNDAGVLYRRRKTTSPRPITGRNKDGYVRVMVDGYQTVAHRIIWLMVYGEQPDAIDHINGNRSDNRLANLRVATPSENQWNRKKRNASSSVFKGVHYAADRSRWGAQIRYRGRLRSLGYFDTEREAHDAYIREARRLFGAFSNDGIA